MAVYVEQSFFALAALTCAVPDNKYPYMKTLSYNIDDLSTLSFHVSVSDTLLLSQEIERSLNRQLAKRGHTQEVATNVYMLGLARDEDKVHFNPLYSLFGENLAFEFHTGTADYINYKREKGVFGNEEEFRKMQLRHDRISLKAAKTPQFYEKVCLLMRGFIDETNWPQIRNLALEQLYISFNSNQELKDKLSPTEFNNAVYEAIENLERNYAHGEYRAYIEEKLASQK